MEQTPSTIKIATGYPHEQSCHYYTSEHSFQGKLSVTTLQLQMKIHTYLLPSPKVNSVLVLVVKYPICFILGQFIYRNTSLLECKNT